MSFKCRSAVKKRRSDKVAEENKQKIQKLKNRLERLSGVSFISLVANAESFAISLACSLFWLDGC